MGRLAPRVGSIPDAEASEHRFKMAFAHAAIGVAITDLGGRFRRANSAFCQILRMTEQELLATDLLSLTHLEDREAEADSIRWMVRNGDCGFVTEKRYCSPHGPDIWAQDSVAPLRNANGVPTRLLIFAQDISQRRRMEQALRENEQRSRLTFDMAPIGIALTALDGRWLRVNRSLCDLLGYDERTMLTLTFQEVTHPDDLDTDLELSERLLAGAIDRYTMEKRYLHRLGHIVWIQLHVALIRDEDGQPQCFIAQMKAIGDRKRAEQENARLLREAQSARDRLEAMSRRLVTLQEEERRRIARELHDEIGQVLTGLQLMMEAGARSGPVSALQRAREIVVELMGRVRDLSRDLRPPMLDDLGLVPTLLWHLENLRQQVGMEVLFHHRGLDGRLPADIELTVFRVVQEALTNVVRHAGVRRATIALAKSGQRLRLHVQDAGRGFDARAIAPGTNGLSCMRERVLLAGGTVALESAPGKGTRITLELPLMRRPNDLSDVAHTRAPATPAVPAMAGHRIRPRARRRS